MAKNIQKELEDYQASCEESQSNQTGKVSSISRGIVYGIIATIWVLITAGDKFSLNNINLLLQISLILSFIYLVLDLTHYFVDALRYRFESFRLDKKDISDEFKLNSCKSTLDNISIWSFIAVAFKYIITLAIVVVFVFGLLLYFQEVGQH